MPWTLVAFDGARRLRHPLVGPDTIVGTGEDADVRLDHPTVSRRHARLSTGDGVVLLEDLGSSNGTRLDGVAVDGRTEVRDGQVLHLGSLECRIEPTDAAELEVAVEFDGGREEQDAATAVGTLSVGSIRDFVLTSLPGIVALLEQHRRPGAERSPGDLASGALDVVQAAGQSLFSSFPCRSLDIVDVGGAGVDGGGAGEAGQAEEGEAVLFRAVADETEDREGPASSGEDTEPTEIRAGRLLARVRFTPGLHLGGVLPLVELVIRLAALDLQGRSPEAAPSGQRPADAPELPRPATVDPVVRRIYDDARRLARGDVGILIMGESGTGKEVLAQFVHACSSRAAGELVALNCAALPQDLLEAELFGIERGVATGVEARAGKFEQAHDGTLFLDEIGDMAPETQAKILRVLQEGEVYRLGGREPRPARVRVIAATNRPIERMVEEGDFRLDLYHRIADCRFTLPPLRERLVDLPNLAAWFLQRAGAEQGVQVRGISRAALEALVTFHWPGNVRQLEREMARAALFLEDGELLQTRHLHEEVAGTPASRRGVAGSSLRARLEATERALITETLMRLDGNVRAAAEELEIGRTTLYRRLQELEIEV